MTEPAAIVWDFDGTLIDSEPIWMEIERATLARYGATVPADFADQTVGGTILKTATLMAGLTGGQVTPEQMADETVGAMVERLSTGDIPWLPGVEETLRAVAAAGIRQAVSSASYRPILDAVLRRVDAPFDVIVSGDQVTNGKPHPESYLRACEELGVDPADVLVVEDSTNGCASANAAGCAVLAVPSVVTPPPAARRVFRDSLAGLGVDGLRAAYAEACAASPGEVTDPEAQPRGTVRAGVHTGPLQAGERVVLTDPKGRRHSLLLQAGKEFHTAKGKIEHDELIGGPEGVVVRSSGGVHYLALRPLMNEFTVSMPRGAAVIYPKEIGQILVWCDIFPGARVLEAGVGSGALSIALLRMIGEGGRLWSYERREDFAEVAQKNVAWFNGTDPERPHPAWEVRVGDLVERLTAEQGTAADPTELDRVVLDMLAPWECVDAVAERLVPGGVLCCYVATTTQLARTMDTIRAHGGFTEPSAQETIQRDWHAEGLAVRPGHGTSSHTGFLIFARRLAPGVTAPLRRRRPAPGAYGKDYTGPRPAGMPDIDPAAEGEGDE